MRRTVLLASLAALLVLPLGAGAASAGAPTSETVVFGPDTFYDEFLSEACGVDVYTTATGRQKGLTFEADSSGVQRVGTLNVSLIARVGDNSVRFRDVGADVVKIGPDGTLTLQVIGQIPFDFYGVLKVNLTTGEIVHEPGHLVDTSEVCAALTA